MIDKLFSKQIAMLRFVLIDSIVYIHMHTGDIHFQGDYSLYFDRVVTYISEYLARLSVPLFFLFSGYLFFVTFKFDIQTFFKKYKSRFYSLFIPFIFWNSVIFIFYFLAQSNPSTAGYFSGDRPIIPDLDILERVRLFWGLREFEYPVAYQFWFIRDLLILVIFSPLLYLLLRYLSWIWLGAIFLLWFFEVKSEYVIQSDFTSLFFFSLGGHMALKRWNMHIWDSSVMSMTLLYLIVSLTALLYENSYLQQISILIGIFLVLAVTSHLAKREFADRLISMQKYSFFLFALHEPLQSILRKMVLKIVDIKSDIELFLLYLTIPILTILIVIFCYKLCERYCFGLLSIVTGNRAS